MTFLFLRKNARMRTMKTKVLPLLGIVLFLSACSTSSSPEVSRDAALSLLKRFDLEINYTPSRIPPVRYALQEKMSTYVEDDAYTIEDVQIDRELDRENHYCYAKIQGMKEGHPYIHESWTYISIDKNITCHYWNGYENGKWIKERYRLEVKKSEESWENTASEEIKEMNRLYGQMALTFYQYLLDMKDETNGEYHSNDGTSLTFVSEDDSYRYEGEFQNNLYQSGARINKETGMYYQSKVSWNHCDISMPSLDYFPLRTE